MLLAKTPLARETEKRTAEMESECILDYDMWTEVAESNDGKSRESECNGFGLLLLL